MYSEVYYYYGTNRNSSNETNVNPATMKKKNKQCKIVRTSNINLTNYSLAPIVENKIHDSSSQDLIIDGTFNKGIHGYQGPKLIVQMRSLVNAYDF